MDRTASIDSLRDTTPIVLAAAPTRSLARLLPLVAAALLGACGQRGSAPGEASGRTALSHAALTGQPLCAGPGVHDVHVALFRCDTCHPTGATFGFDVPFTFAGGTSTAGGVLMRDAAGVSCAVACHSPKGAPAATISWSAPGPLACTSCHAPEALPGAHPPVAASASREECQACHRMDGHLGGTVMVAGHGTDWMNPASPGFHAATANAGLEPCRGCHGPNLVGAAGPACGSCHDAGLPAGIASWAVNCVMCHGGVELANGAPPKATWGNAGDPVRAGAHTRHLTATSLAPAAPCAACHAVPADAFTPAHLDGGTAEVVLARAAPGATAAWDRASATCSSTWCHAGAAGGTRPAPAWTRLGEGDSACGACHGLPPPAPHPSVSAGLAGCAGCHLLTLDASGAIIPPDQGGKHLNGSVEATGGHPATFKDPASPGFHAYAANRGLASCQGCHGPALDGVGGSASVSCATCHGEGWAGRCTMCHGGVADATGAPPRATWGNAADPLRVGAHAKHVAGGAVSGPVACTTCHAVPADAFAAGHLDDGPAEVVFGGLAAASGATPGWDPASGSCASTYCHGGYSGVHEYTFYEDPRAKPYAGANATPSWAGGPMTCSSCHGDPPDTGAWHGLHTAGTECQLCHPDASGEPGASVVTNPALHVNGVIDISPQWRSRCLNCH